MPFGREPVGFAAWLRTKLNVSPAVWFLALCPIRVREWGSCCGSSLSPGYCAPPAPGNTPSMGTSGPMRWTRSESRRRLSCPAASGFVESVTNARRGPRKDRQSVDGCPRAWRSRVAVRRWRLAASPGGGVWRTVDGGANWTFPSNDGAGDYSVVHLEWDAIHPGRLFALSYSGLHASTNRADSWTALIDSVLRCCRTRRRSPTRNPSRK
jgi:hypothetical protein